MSRRRLGKGIDALLQGRDLEQLSNISSIVNIPIDRVRPNPSQPRKRFDDDSIRELADSIRERGIIQPIIAEDQGDGTYLIVAGERRYRAAQIAGLDELPLLPQDFTEEEKLEIALIENLQREDLNPVDESRALQVMVQNGFTQQEIAKRLGLSRPAVANSLRLLRLEPEILDAIEAGTVTAGHARALLRVEDPVERKELFGRILSEELSVRAVEAVTRVDGAAVEPDHDVPAIIEQDDIELPREANRTTPTTTPALKELEDRLVDHLATKVKINGSEDKGRIEITYTSVIDLDRLIEIIGLPHSDPDRL